MNAPANVTRMVFELIGCKEEVRVLGFTGDEHISGLFEFTLDVLCKNGALDVDGLIAKTGLLTLSDSRINRLLHGVITRAQHINQGRRFTQFSITMAPKPSYLQFRSGSRIFQDQSVPGIIKTLLNESGILGGDVRFNLKHKYPTRSYCVQYQETEWDFICRLLEEEGLFYYFEHTLDRHTLVIGDHNSCFKALPGPATIAYHPVTGQLSNKESIHAFSSKQTISAGNVCLQDYNFEKPQLNLLSLATSKNHGARSDFEHYHYPGSFQNPQEGKRYAQLQLEALNTFSTTATINTSSQRFQPGYVIGINNHPRHSVNRDYLVTQVTHIGRQPQSLEEGATNEAYSYEAKATLVPNNATFRTIQTHFVSVAGTETATVTGPPGEEIYTDNHARIKVRFHWDRHNGYDENSSCWVRVSQAVTGNQWGSISIPRVGEEVIIAYEAGMPNRPIVIGRTFNAQNPAPYPLPANKTRTALKTLSTPNGGGFNEIRIEDKKGGEQIFIHAEKDLDIKVKNDWRETIDNDEHLTIGETSFTTIKKDHHQTIDSQHNISIGKNQSVQAGKDTHIKVGKNFISQAQEIHIKAGTLLVIESGSEVVIKAGSGLITLNPAGVTIKGAMVKINSGGGGGSAKAASPDVPTAPTLPTDEKTGKASTAAPAKQHKASPINLSSASVSSSIQDISQSTSTLDPTTPTSIEIATNPAQDTLNILALLPNNTPAAGFAYKATFNDGNSKTGTLDSDGKTTLAGVTKGSAQVIIGDTVAAAEVVQLRQQMSQLFQAIVRKEKSDAAALERKRLDKNLLEQAIAIDDAITRGIWKGAVGLLTWVSDVNDVVNPVMRLRRQLSAAWDSYSSDTQEWGAEYVKAINKAEHKELVEALGFDPAKLTPELLAEAYEITGYIFDDPDSRALVLQFAKDYANAQDRLEWAEFAGGALFEIILSAIIVAATGGLGIAAVGAKSTRHLGKLKELGEIFRKLTAKLKAVKLRKVKTGYTGETVTVKLDKPRDVEFQEFGNASTIQQGAKVPNKNKLTTADLIKLKANSKAHTLERHGPEVPVGKLKVRATEGIAPDASSIPKIQKKVRVGNVIPPLSSKFDSVDSVDSLKLALKSTDTNTQSFANALSKAQADLLPGKTLTRLKFQVDLGQPVGFGFKAPVGSPKFVLTGKKLSGTPVRVDNLTRAEARFQLNPSTGNFELNTLFPVK